MKQAVAVLIPHIEEEKRLSGETRSSQGLVVIATVKGDVHDIGKNIVAVILRCNNFEVTDLGVMVPGQNIIATALKEKADIIGLSGLITPSLEEMRLVAAEMKLQGLELPLMIGGATTSPVHTALKIEPEYDQGVFWVKDASRAVGVARQLINQDQRQSLQEKTAGDYQALRDRRARGSRRKPPVSLSAARDNRLKIDWKKQDLSHPVVSGVHALSDYPLDRLVDFIDWTPFFQAWELAGRFPGILEDPVVGEVATSLYQDASDMLERIVKQKWLQASAVYGIFPAASNGDDVLLPDNQAAMGAIEGAVGDLEAAVSAGLLDSVQGTQCMTQLASAARQLAVAAIDAAIAGGGDPDKIADAQLALDDGDALRSAESFKDAVAMYKDALAQAEGA